MSAQSPGYAIYDLMAEAYVRKNADGPYNAHFERPSMLALLPSVAGKEVLDLGCGPGGLAACLVAQGAFVTGADGSEAMLAAAREKLGAQVPLVKLDLAQGLREFAPGSFDVVVSSLTIHYLEDLPKLAAEIGRVLRPGGTFACSTHHPMMDFDSSPTKNYFATEHVCEDWDVSGEKFPVSFFRRPLSATCSAFFGAGMNLEALTEGVITPELLTRFPRQAERLARTPQFLFFRWRKV